MTLLHDFQGVLTGPLNCGCSADQQGSGLTPSRRVRKLREQLTSFMAEHVYPAEHLLEVCSRQLALITPPRMERP